jgi:hypothetical protein
MRKAESRQDPASGAPGVRLGRVGSWVLVVVCCSLLVLYLILHTREIGLIFAWFASA